MEKGAIGPVGLTIHPAIPRLAAHLLLVSIKTNLQLHTLYLLDLEVSLVMVSGDGLLLVALQISHGKE